MAATGKVAEQIWTAPTDREQQVVALCCLEYSDREIAAMLDISYGTARTHLYNAIHTLGITKKLELHFLLGNWDFSQFDLSLCCALQFAIFNLQSKIGEATFNIQPSPVISTSILLTFLLGLLNYSWGAQFIRSRSSPTGLPISHPG